MPKLNQKNLSAQNSLLDAGILIITILFASHRSWSAKDLVWSMWISSLTLGYTYIITSIISGLFHGNLIVPDQEKSMEKLSGILKKARQENMKLPGEGVVESIIEIQSLVFNLFFSVVLFSMFGRIFLHAKWLFLLILLSTLLGIGALLRRKEEFKFLPNPRNPIVRTIILLPQALFFLGFFTIHFLGFHFIHGLFLNMFFPLISENPFGKTIGQTIGFFQQIIATALHEYWFFILVSAFSRIESYLQAFRKAGMQGMFEPYGNVVRMHLMIFIFAFMKMLRVEPCFMYLSLIFYFFPIGSLLGIFQRKPGKNQSFVEPDKRSQSPQDTHA